MILGIELVEPGDRGRNDVGRKGGWKNAAGLFDRDRHGWDPGERIGRVSIVTESTPNSPGAQATLVASLNHKGLQEGEPPRLQRSLLPAAVLALMP